MTSFVVVELPGPGPARCRRQSLERDYHVAHAVVVAVVVGGVAAQGHLDAHGLGLLGGAVRRDLLERPTLATRPVARRRGGVEVVQSLLDVEGRGVLRRDECGRLAVGGPGGVLGRLLDRVRDGGKERGRSLAGDEGHQLGLGRVAGRRLDREVKCGLQLLGGERPLLVAALERDAAADDGPATSTASVVSSALMAGLYHRDGDGELRRVEGEQQVS